MVDEEMHSFLLLGLTITNLRNVKLMGAIPNKQSTPLTTVKILIQFYYSTIILITPISQTFKLFLILLRQGHFFT